jgi:hypothetical protein
MIIECPHCDSRVDGKILAQKDYAPTEESEPHRTLFLECPVGHACIVAGQDLIQTGGEEWNYCSAMTVVVINGRINPTFPMFVSQDGEKELVGAPKEYCMEIVIDPFFDPLQHLLNGEH